MRPRIKSDSTQQTLPRLVILANELIGESCGESSLLGFSAWSKRAVAQATSREHRLLHLNQNPEQKRGKEGGGLGAGNWGLWFPPPDAGGREGLKHERLDLALRQARLVVLPLAFHRDALLKRHGLPRK